MRFNILKVILFGIVILLLTIDCADNSNKMMTKVKSFYTQYKDKNFEEFNGFMIYNARGMYEVTFLNCWPVRFLVRQEKKSDKDELKIIERKGGFQRLEDECNYTKKETVDIINKLFKEFTDLKLFALVGDQGGHYYEFIFSESIRLFYVPDYNILTEIELKYISCDANEKKIPIDDHWHIYRRVE